jgi:tRNA nucleotidyltransferase (CCA-adding enzyme)
MVTYDIGRLPGTGIGDQLVGVVTRTDVLRQLHRDQQEDTAEIPDVSPPLVRQPSAPQLWRTLRQAAGCRLWNMLQDMAAVALDRGWQLYLVGGGVRDLFLSEPLAPNH